MVFVIQYLLTLLISFFLIMAFKMCDRRMSVKAIPNSLTVIRLLSAPVTVWLIGENMMTAAFWLFMVAAATDVVDGAVAKIFNARTRIGSYLDPLADKVLLVGVYMSLGTDGYLPPWLVILVVSRDILIVSGALLYELVIGNLVMRPLFISKLNTLGQIILAGIVLGEQGFGLDTLNLVDLLIRIVSVTAILSTIAYGWILSRQL